MTDGVFSLCYLENKQQRIARGVIHRIQGHRSMLGPGQLIALKDWFNDGSGRVKLVVTSVPFFPDIGKDENADTSRAAMQW